MIPDPQIELTLAYHSETAMAVLVSLNGDVQHAVWLPKSRIIVASSQGLGRRWLIQMPRSLARTKGLIAERLDGQGRLL
jgi:hypothetical protein